MTDLELKQLRESLDQLKGQVQILEAEIGTRESLQDWAPTTFYSAFYITTGFGLGCVAAMSSLLFNITGSPAAGNPPLAIIGVYLTIPLGAPAR